MRKLHGLPLAALLVFGVAATAPLTGCKASLQIGEKKPEAPPAPPPDGDGDGILDADDKCPDAKEDGKAPNPSDGCPNLDEDSDGIDIPADKCPTEAETKNGFQDEDGCPDEKPLVEVTEKEVKINQKIQFEKGKSEITEDSMKVVNAVAQVLKDHPEIQLIEVGGHASKEGAAALNKSLTQSRVESVSAELVKLGVEKSRLISQGYGFYCPQAEGETPEALEANRRVEFHILQSSGKVVEGAVRGCDESLKAGIKPLAMPAVKPYTAPPADAAKKEEPKKPLTGLKRAPAAAETTAPAAETTAPAAETTAPAATN
jgi:outer membrane protein OmpA-like peptidoglycan-associated protein